MRPHRLQFRQLLPLDIETAFSFFADARNLQRLTPPWLHFRIITPGEIEMRQGTLIDYNLRLRGVPIRWQSEITVWEPPYRFQDVQRRGPYRLWEHTHSFESIGGATLVTDEVVYSVPGGAAIDRVLVRPDLDRIFNYRREQLEHWAIGVLRDRMAPSRELSQTLAPQ